MLDRAEAPEVQAPEVALVQLRRHTWSSPSAPPGVRAEAEEQNNLPCVAWEEVEEHPLRWLQPTPPQSPQLTVALHAPEASNMNILDVIGEATRCSQHELSMHDREKGGSDGSTTVSDDGFAPSLSQGLDGASAGPMMEAAPPLPQPWGPYGQWQAAEQWVDQVWPPSFGLEPFSPLAAWSGSSAGSQCWLGPQDSSRIEAMPRAVLALEREVAPPQQAVGPPCGSVEQPAVVLPSAGSLNHRTGKCKPCAFVHRDVGCADGANCTFCHLCGPNEKKLRQKQKSEAMRQRRLQRMAKRSPDADPEQVPCQSPQRATS